VPDVHRRVRGVQLGDFGAQLAGLGDQGLRLSHRASISTLTPLGTSQGKCRKRSLWVRSRDSRACAAEGPAERPIIQFPPAGGRS
jgi:hypothetical protein